MALKRCSRTVAESKMKERPSWIKKNLFYVILFLCAAMLIGGYFVWFLQPVPLIPENAENIQVAEMGYANESVSSTDVHIFIIPYENGKPERLIRLNAEGQALLIEKLKTVNARAYTESNVVTPYPTNFDNRIGLNIRYQVGDLQYNRFISIYSYLQATGRPYSEDPNAKRPLRPENFFDLEIKNLEQLRDLYDFIMDLADNYAE